MKKNLDFGKALAALKEGERVAREGWLASQSDMLLEDWGILD